MVLTGSLLRVLRYPYRQSGGVCHKISLEAIIVHMRWAAKVGIVFT